MDNFFFFTIHLERGRSLNWTPCYGASEINALLLFIRPLDDSGEGYILSLCEKMLRYFGGIAFFLLRWS